MNRNGKVGENGQANKQVYWTQNTFENLKKKAGACVFWAPVFFSKSFGGKIHHIWTDVTYRMNKKNFLKSPLNSFFLSKSTAR